MCAAGNVGRSYAALGSTRSSHLLTAEITWRNNSYCFFSVSIDSVVQNTYTGFIKLLMHF